MKILHLAHRLPFPPNKGDKIRTFHVLNYLARRNEIYLATLIDNSADLAHVPELRPHVERLLFSRIDGLLQKISALCQWPFGGSITVSHFHRQELQRDVDRLIDEVQFDLVLCSSSAMAEYVFRSKHWGGRLKGIPKVMDLIDVDSLKWKQYSMRVRSPRRLVYSHESKHLANYERKIYKYFDRLLLVSKTELDYFPGGDPSGKLVAIPNGVDTSYFSSSQQIRSHDGGPKLVFVGMMDYWPNIEGVKWFIDEVLPLIRASVPGTRLLVVGGRPTAKVIGWGGKNGIEVTGYVADVRHYLAAADVCVVPLRIARGIQNKVLEAMAMGKPIVTTPQALEGIEAANGEHAMIAADAREFADAVTSLLRDLETASAIGRAARDRVESHYSWNSNLSGLDEVIGALTARPCGCQ